MLLCVYATVKGEMRFQRHAGGKPVTNNTLRRVRARVQTRAYSGHRPDCVSFYLSP